MQKAFIWGMGVHDMANFDIDAVMKADEDQAEDLGRAAPRCSTGSSRWTEAIAAGAG